MPSADQSTPALVEEHWKNWPTDKGFNPEYEQRTLAELPVIGKIPAYAAGTLYRNGPGKSQGVTEEGEPYKITHWFDGFSQTHRFKIVDSGESTRVFYNSRFATDNLIKYVEKTGSLASLRFGQKQDLCNAVFKKVQTEFVPLPTGPTSKNTSVTLSINLPGFDAPPENGLNDRWANANGPRTLYAKTDSNLYKKLDPETLEPLALYTQEALHPELTGFFTASHPRSDPETGNVYNYNLTPGPISTYRIFEVSAATGNTIILATFTGIPAYIHSLQISKDYVILCVWNSHLNLAGFIKGGSFSDAMVATDPSSPAIWYVVDRKHGKGLVATYESPAFFAFHAINAWQEPSKEDPTKIDIIADIIRLPSSDFITSYFYDHLISSLPSAKEFAGKRDDTLRSTFARFRLPTVPSSPSSDVQKATLEWSVGKQLSPELPTMNPNFVTQKHRYVYANSFSGKSTFSDGILKFDNETQETSLWEVQGHSPGEAIFVPNPNGVSEDDGVLLSVVLDGHGGHSYLLCLDARNLTELARANVDGVVGFGFHGQHVSNVGIPTGDY